MYSTYKNSALENTTVFNHKNKKTAWMHVSGSTQLTQHPTINQTNTNTKHKRKKIQDNEDDNQKKTKCMHPFSHSGTKQRFSQGGLVRKESGCTCRQHHCTRQEQGVKGTYPTTKQRKKKKRRKKDSRGCIQLASSHHRVNKANREREDTKARSVIPPSPLNRLSFAGQSASQAHALSS